LEPFRKEAHGLELPYLHIGRGKLLRILLGMLAGFAVVIGIFGLPSKAEKFWIDFQRERAIQEAREKAVKLEQDFAGWYVAPADCAATRSSLRALECKNQRDMAHRAFMARHKNK
jgi:hypothetical protein